MSSPSQPRDIRSPPRLAPDSTTDAPNQGHTPSSYQGPGPDLRALRAAYIGTPPPMNIPLRNAGTPGSRRDSNTFVTGGGGGGNGNGSGAGVGAAGGEDVMSTPPRRPPPFSTTPNNNNSGSGSGSGSNAGSNTGISQGGLSATRISNLQPAPSPSPAAIDLDDLPDEEKARVIERHLVSKELRGRVGTPVSSTPTPSGAGAGTGHSSGSLVGGGAEGGNGSGSGTGNGKSKPASVLEVPGGSGESETSVPTLSRRSSDVGKDDEPFPIPYDSHGGDVTHEIYKWHTKTTNRVRSASFAGSSHPPHPAFEHIHEPGGFRRNYVLLRANEQGGEEPRMLNNFIDFLLLFGHFAGEDLEEEEDDDEDKEDDDLDIDHTIPEDEDEETLAGMMASAGSAQHRAALASSSQQPQVHVDESTALLKRSGSIGLSGSGYGHGAAASGSAYGQGSGYLDESPNVSRSRSRSRRRKNSVSRQGTATVTQAVFMLLKSFVGTGVLFLGKAFYNGGILFSSITFVCIACVSLYSFLLLVKTKFVVSGSFGDIGGTLYGPWMRYLILGSIVVSQMGFVGAYTIFVAQNLQAFLAGITECAKLLPVQFFIVLQLVVFLPLALVRDLAKLSSTALVADAFILAGLLYIFGSEISLIVDRGVAKVELFNPRDFSLFIGTAVFSFEGIGLVIPITDAMREPHKFPKALTGVMAFLLCLFGGAGALAYLTFGSAIQTNVLVNLDARSPSVQSVQLLYALAILLSVPLQLFPAIRILEVGLFTTKSGRTRSGKENVRVKWAKNVFRGGMVLCCTVISWLGARDLDKFVAFVGCFACVPLCYVYPAMLHLKACAKTRRQKVADYALIVFGLLAAAYTSWQTLKLMIEPSPVEDSPYGHCDPGQA